MKVEERELLRQQLLEATEELHLQKEWNQTLQLKIQKYKSRIKTTQEDVKFAESLRAGAKSHKNTTDTSSQDLATKSNQDEKHKSDSTPTTETKKMRRRSLSHGVPTNPLRKLVRGSTHQNLSTASSSPPSSETWSGKDKSQRMSMVIGSSSSLNMLSKAEDQEVPRKASSPLATVQSAREQRVVDSIPINQAATLPQTARTAAEDKRQGGKTET